MKAEKSVGAAEDMHSAIAVLTEFGWFAERAPEIRNALVGVARLRNYAQGQPLYQFGDPPDGVYGLVEGVLEISIPRADGTDLVVHRANPGFWVGESALIANQTRLVSIHAVADSRIMFLPDAGLRRLTQTDPSFYRDLYALSHQNLTTTLQLLGNLATNPAEARVALRLLQQTQQWGANAELHVSHAKLAELVALSTPTLQRVLRRLAAGGLVELTYGRIRILDRRGLAELCGREDTVITNG